MTEKITYILIFMLLLLPLVLWTQQRNEVWKSELSLTEDCLFKSPNKTRVLVNYAFACKRAGNHDEEGIAALTKAVTIDPELIYYFAALRFVIKEKANLIIQGKGFWDYRGKP